MFVLSSSSQQAMRDRQRESREGGRPRPLRPSIRSSDKEEVHVLHFHQWLLPSVSPPPALVFPFLSSLFKALEMTCSAQTTSVRENNHVCNPSPESFAAGRLQLFNSKVSDFMIFMDTMGIYICIYYGFLLWIS